jgi:AcrR family transcriptional regulator
MFVGRGHVDVRQQAIIARIRLLIEERGYDAVSVDAMAAAAGISKATFYRAFPAKEAVRVALRAAGVAPERLDARNGREALLDAAMDVFAAQGYGGATIEAIAQAAGMSKAGFYWHFESKEAIFLAVIARFAPFATVAHIVTEGEATGEEPRAVLTRVLQAIAAAATARFALFRTVMLEAFQNPEMGAVFARNVLGVALPIVGGYLTQQMAAGRMRRMHPAVALQSLIGPLFFHLLTRDMFVAQAGEMPPLERVIAQIVTTFLDGVGIRPGERDEEGGPYGGNR